MIRTVLLLLVIVMLTELGLGQEPRKSRVRRAVGSTSTTIEKHPYTVSVIDLEGEYCGGFIVSKINVITACHCFEQPADLSKILVHVGSNSTPYTGTGGMLLSLKNLKCHENFEIIDGSVKNDIAILELDTPLTYGPNVNKVELYDRVLAEDESLSQPAVQTGWGSQPPDGVLASTIQALELPVISKKQCKADYMDVGRPGIDGLFEDQMCAGEKATTVTKSACIGDSGSPLVIEENGIKYAIGVTASSHSGYCDEPTYPNIFSEVAYHLPWIKNHVKFD